MTLSDGGIDTRLIVGSIADEGRKRSCDLVEQGLNLSSIVSIAVGQL